jgi:hypothetical protein
MDIDNILASLNRIDDKISEILIRSTPEGDAQVESMHVLLDQQSRLEATINHLIELRFQSAFADLKKATAALSTQTTAIEGLANQMSSVTSAIEIVADVIKTVAQVAAVVAAFAA